MKNGISGSETAFNLDDSCESSGLERNRFGPSLCGKSVRAKILAVDDNLVVATILSVSLKASGHRVTSVFNGQEAIERLRSETFDLVVLDLNLPDYSGFEILELVKRHDLCPRTPIVVVSSSEDDYDISRARRLGAAGYFAKVVSPETLPDKIERILVGRNIAWIDDYHCVIDARTPDVQALLLSRPRDLASPDRVHGATPAARSKNSARAVRPQRAECQQRRPLVQ